VTYSVSLTLNVFEMVNTYSNNRKNIFAGLVFYGIYSAQLVSDLYVK